jgi:hypothetical protein
LISRNSLIHRSSENQSPYLIEAFVPTNWVLNPLSTSFEHAVATTREELSLNASTIYINTTNHTTQKHNAASMGLLPFQCELLSPMPSNMHQVHVLYNPIFKNMKNALKVANNATTLCQ